MNSSLALLVPLALLLGVVALVIFFWTLKSDQYEDLEGAAERIFLDEDGDRSGHIPGNEPAANENDLPRKSTDE